MEADSPPLDKDEDDEGNHLPSKQKHNFKSQASAMRKIIKVKVSVL